MPKVQFLRLPHGQGVELPSYATEGAAGADIRAGLNGHTLIIQPGQRIMVPTGLRVAIEPGYEIQVRPRSGLAAKHGLTIVNAPGTIDEDYRGEIMVIALNTGAEPVEVRHNDRIAQIVIAPVVRSSFEEIDEVEFNTNQTDRGAAGFGSTGRG